MSRSVFILSTACSTFDYSKISISMRHVRSLNLSVFLIIFEQSNRLRWRITSRDESR